MGEFVEHPPAEAAEPPRAVVRRKGPGPGWIGPPALLIGLAVGVVIGRGRPEAPRTAPARVKAGEPVVAQETPPPAPPADAGPAWDDIRRQAEKTRAEQDEAERLKQEAARTPPRPPLPQTLDPSPAEARALALAQLAAHQERVRQLMRMQGEFFRGPLPMSSVPGGLRIEVRAGDPFGPLPARP